MSVSTLVRATLAHSDGDRQLAGDVQAVVRPAFAEVMGIMLGWHEECLLAAVDHRLLSCLLGGCYQPGELHLSAASARSMIAGHSGV